MNTIRIMSASRLPGRTPAAVATRHALAGYGPLSAAGPSLLHGFKCKVQKFFVHPCRSLINVEDNHPDARH